MMKKLMTLLLFLIVISSIGYAQEYNCTDADTSLFSTTITVSGSEIPISYDETCMFSCNEETGRCNPSPYDVGVFEIGVVIVLLFLALIFFYVSFKTDQEVYKLLYFFMALLFIIASILTTISVVQHASKSDVLGGVQFIIVILMVVVMLTTFLLFLMVLKDAMDVLKKKKMI